MTRLDRMRLKIFVPSVAVFLFAGALSLISSMFAGTPFLVELARPLDLAGACVLLLGVGLVGYAFYQLWQWDNGTALLCAHCDGLLGWERLGRYGIYRRCLACRRKIDRQDYA